MSRQGEHRRARQETDSESHSKVVPSTSETSLNSLRMSLDSKEDSSLSYNSMEMNYRRKNKQTYHGNDNHYHYHSLEVCMKRQPDGEFAEKLRRGQTFSSSFNQYEASGGGGATASTNINSVQENNNSASVGGTLSSGYSSGSNREKCWIEMDDGQYGNEMRKRVYLDTPLLNIKQELMGVADKWKLKAGREDYKILNKESKIDLCQLDKISLQQPTRKNQCFMVLYN